MCSACGGNYHRKETHAGPVWTCGRFNTFGKSACASKRVPEDTLMSVTSTALGLATFHEKDFRYRVDRIQVCDGNTLIYRFKTEQRSVCNGKINHAAKAGRMK
ncbi:MAG: hypothetical protein Q8S22_06100 [Eubacteriales bacterium]|nr:hypothetical protein [Eubacteriales bacterium]